MAEQDIETFKAQLLWRKARRRVRFKRFFILAILVSLASWFYWYKFMIAADAGIPWPFLLTAVLVILLLILFLRAYVFSNDQSVINEYQKLKSKK
jgi:hypothetical protein